MVDFDVNKSNIQNQELSANPAGSEEVSVPKKPEKPTIKYIFEQQMTRQQVADEFGQVGLDMFDKANTDGKDGISEDEYKSYTENESDMADSEQITTEENSVVVNSGKNSSVSSYTNKLNENKYEFRVEFKPNLTLKNQESGNTSALGITKMTSLEDTISQNIQTPRLNVDINQYNTPYISEMDKIKYMAKIKQDQILNKVHKEEIDERKIAKENAYRFLNKEIHNALENDDLTTVEYLSNEQMEKTMQILQGNEFNLLGLTKEEAINRNPKLEKLFNEISSDGKVITEQDIAKHMQKQLKNSGITIHQIAKTFSSEDADVRVKLSRAGLNAIVDKDAKSIIDMSNVNNSLDILKELYKKNGKKLDENGNIPQNELEFYKQNPDELSKQIIYEIKESFVNDTHNDIYKTERDRLANGKFHKSEIIRYGIDPNKKLSDEDLDKYAKRAVLHRYLASVKQVADKIFEDGITEEKVSMVRGLLEDFKEDKDVQAFLMSIGIRKVTVDDKVAGAKLSNDVAKDKDFTVESSIAGADITSTILQTADDTDAIQEFITNNAAQADMIDEVSHVVLQTMPESEYKTNLENIINQTLENIYNGTISGYNGGSPENGDGEVSGASFGNNGYSGGNAQLTAQEWSSNPITMQVYDTRQANNEWSQNQGIADYGATEQAAHILSNRIGIELGTPKPIRYNDVRVKRLLKDFNNTINGFDGLSEKEKQKVDEYFSAAPSSTIVSIMVQGNNKVQKYLLGYISTEGIAKNIKKKDDIKNLIPQIQASLAEYQKLNVSAGIRKLDQMTDTEKEMYRLNENYT